MNFKFLLIPFLCISVFLPEIFFAQGQGAKLNSKEVKLLIDSVGLALNRWYIYPDKALLISKGLKDNYKKGVYNSVKTSKELGDMLQSDIQKIYKDGHILFFYDPLFAKGIWQKLPDSLQKVEDEMLLTKAKETNFMFVKTEILPCNVGYLRWDGFVDCTKEAEPTFNSAFQFVANTRALIIDLRYNRGGSPQTVLAMQNYFLDKKTPMDHIIGRNSDTNKRYTDPGKTNFKLKMPVYILTSRTTFSGGEDFTYGLKYAKRVTVVGDTTGGGAHPSGPYYLGQGFVLVVPGYRIVNEFSKTDWEGTGIWPDVYVNSELALEKGMTLVYKNLLTKANDAEKKLIQWNLIVAENKLSLRKRVLTDSLKLSHEILLSYCGEYTSVPGSSSSPLPISIILKNGQLYRRFGSTADVRLLPISETRFLYDDDTGRFLDLILKGEQIEGCSVTREEFVFRYNKVK